VSDVEIATVDMFPDILVILVVSCTPQCISLNLIYTFTPHNIFMH